MSQVTIRTSTKGTGYYVKAPYNKAAVAAWRAIPGRKFDRDAGENYIPMEQKRALWNLLRTYYAGQTLVTDLVGTIGPIPQSFASDQYRQQVAEVQAAMDAEMDASVGRYGSKESFDKIHATLDEALEKPNGYDIAPPIAAAPPELMWGDPSELKTPAMVEIAKANGWEVVELPAVSEALSKRATRPARAKRARRSRP